MQYITLGRTGLRVSVAGLGCGGASRIGLGRGKSNAEAINIVRSALDLGINVIDTAQSYGTEEVVGQALQGVKRDSYVLASKHLVWREEGFYTPEEIVAGLDNSLRLLKTDHLDIFYMHVLVMKRAGAAIYDYAMNEIVPILQREQQKGKFRFLGATAAPNQEASQEGIGRGVDTNLLDVVMFAFSLFNQSARELIFPKTKAHDVGTMLMFVVRNIFADDEHLRATVKKLVEQGKLPAELDRPDPLDFLVHAGGASSTLDAAYRYARHEPGTNVVLFGTSDVEHMKQNIASINAPALPEADREKIAALFGALVGVGLDIPANRGAAAGALRQQARQGKPAA